MIKLIRKVVSRKAGAYITLIALITFLVLLGYNYFVSKRIVLENIRDNTRALAISALSQINVIMVSSEKLPQNLSCVLESLDLNEEQLLNLLKTLVEKSPDIYGSVVAFEPYMFDGKKEFFCPYYYKDGNTPEFIDLGKSTNYDYLHHEWYLEVKKTGVPLWSEPYFDSDGGEIAMVTYSYPFYKYENGEKIFRGVITCDISLEWLENIVSKIKVFETGYAFVLSPKGTFISHPNKEYYTKQQSFFTLAEKYNDKIEKQLGEKMIRGETGYARYYSHNREKYCYLYYQPLASTGCTLGIVIPEDELLFKLKALTFTLFLIGAIGNLPSIIIRLANKKIIAPLNALRKKLFPGKKK